MLGQGRQAHLGTDDQPHPQAFGCGVRQHHA